MEPLWAAPWRAVARDTSTRRWPAVLAADGEYPPPFALGLGFVVVFDPRSMYSFFLFDSIPFFLSAKPCGAAVAVAARGSQWKGVCVAAVSLAGARALAEAVAGDIQVSATTFLLFSVVRIWRFLCAFQFSLFFEFIRNRFLLTFPIRDQWSFL